MSEQGKREKPKVISYGDNFRARLMNAGLRKGFTEARMMQEESMLPGQAHTNQTAAHPGRKKTWKNPATRG